MSRQVDSPFTRALVAGAFAGTSVDLSLYPIDTIKTRLQSAKGFQASGGFRGVYAGVGSAALGAAPGAALFFVTYETTKSLLRQYRERREHIGQARNWNGPFEHMIAASAGEIAACAVRVPTEVVKQRAQALQYNSSMAALNGILGQRPSIGITGVYRELYRGWSITIMREVPFTVIQFPLWEAMKEWRRNKTGKREVAALDSAVFGSLAGAIAAGLTTPLDVLKTRMMLSKGKTRLMPLLAQILNESGPRAFFAGMGPRMVWISAGGAVFLGSYQYVFNAMGGA